MKTMTCVGRVSRRRNPTLATTRASVGLRASHKQARNSLFTLNYLPKSVPLGRYPFPLKPQSPPLKWRAFCCLGFRQSPGLAAQWRMLVQSSGQIDSAARRLKCHHACLPRLSQRRQGMPTLSADPIDSACSVQAFVTTQPSSGFI